MPRCRAPWKRSAIVFGCSTATSDGVLEGPNLPMYEELASQTSLAIIAAGGVTTVNDIRQLAQCGIEGAIVGRALYTGDIELTDALAAAN